MEQQQGQESAPVMCAAGCGFFGNPASENLCSKCFRDLQSQRGTAAPAPSTPASRMMSSSSSSASLRSPTPAVQAPPVSSSPFSTFASSSSLAAAAAPPASAAAAAAAAPSADASPAPSPSKGKHRCFSCNKSVGLLGFTCRCENQFCAKHRHATEHSCPFDYKSFDRERLEKANPTVQADKVEKI